MTFAAPFALALGAVALPIILAYLHWRKLQQRPVSSVAIFRVLAQRQTARRSLLLPTRLFSLLLVLLALAALLVALIRPRWGESEGGDWVVVLDASSSMAAADGSSGSRFDHAVDALEDHARGLGDRDELSLVAFGPEASVISGPDRDHGAVVARARAIVPAGNEGGLASAIELATALCRKDSQLLWISDRPLPAALETVCPSRAVPIGRKAHNAGITGFHLREADSLGLTEIYVQVTNAGPARSATVDLTVDGATLKVVQLDLPADGAAEALVRVTLKSGDAVEATLRVPGKDALTHDDVAYGAAAAGSAARVLLVTDAERSYFRAALEHHPRAELTVAAPGDATPGRFDLAILESPVTAVPDAARIVAIDEAAALLGVSIGPRLDDPHVIRWAFAHPLFRYVNLEEVHPGPAHALAAPEGSIALMDTASGPIATLSFSGDREVLALGFRPDRSDLVLRVGFANLVANLVEWAAGAESRPPSVPLGSRWTSRSPLRAASGAVVPGGGLITAPGVYAIDDGGVVTADLTSAEETVLGGEHRRFALPTLSGHDVVPWRWLAAVALLLLVAEWLLPGVRSRLAALVPARRPRPPRRSTRVARSSARPERASAAPPRPDRPASGPRQGV